MALVANDKMNGNFKISVRRYPWQWDETIEQMLGETGLSVSIPYVGCSVVSIPADASIDEKSAVKLADYRVNAKTFSLYNVFRPSAKEKIVSDSNSTKINVNIGAGKSLVPARIYRSTGNINVYFSFDSESIAVKNAITDAYQMEWLNFFDELLSEEIASRYCYLDFSSLPKILNKILVSSDEPAHSAIVAISEALASKIDRLGGCLRKILSAKRELVPLNRFNEIDESCLRWIVRQQGRTLQEKASSNNFRLLGITRQENYDLLENRVLKDFLIRCISASSDYMHEFYGTETFRSSVRYRKVRAFRKECEACLARPELGGVLQQKVLPSPNYVLQNDLRYKYIWKQYIKLVRKTKERDDIWTFQQGTFSDLCQVLLHGSIASLATSHENFSSGSESDKCLQFSFACDSPIEFYSEQLLGRRLRSSSVIGPLIVTIAARKYLIDFFSDLPRESQFISSLNDVFGQLNVLGSTCFLFVTPVGDESALKKLIVPIYFVHTADSNQNSFDYGMCHSASESLRKFSATTQNMGYLSGLIFTSFLSESHDNFLGDKSISNNKISKGKSHALVSNEAGSSDAISRFEEGGGSVQERSKCLICPHASLIEVNVRSCGWPNTIKLLQIWLKTILLKHDDRLNGFI